MKNLQSKRRKASVLGETIEYVLAGQGAPALVLVNGSGGPIEAWFRVLEPLTRRNAVLAYNRPGMGRSARPVCPQTASRSVAVLAALLDQLQVARPVVLVGHSLGGLIVNLFARTHPDAVAAVVMLDATATQDVAVLASFETALQRLARRALHRLFPLDPFDETCHVDTSVAEIMAAPGFPPVPLLVVTGGRPAMSWATHPRAAQARARHQSMLASLSPMGRQVIAVRSGHFPQLTEPAFVVDAIRDLVDRSSVAPSRR